MRRLLTAAAQPARLLRLHANSALFTTSAAVLQRGSFGRGGGNSRYGNNSSSGGSPSRDSYPPQRGGNRPPPGSYDSRGGNFGNRPQRGYDDRPSPPPQQYQQRAQGFGNRPQQGSFHNGNGRRQDAGSNQRPRGGGGSSAERPPRRTPQEFLQQDAETLFQMKQAFKQSKTARERTQIRREARRQLRRVRVDPSTQDERSIMIILNCAVTFRSGTTDGLSEASKWVQANLAALSPHNVALYMNALGAIDFEDREEVARKVTTTVLPSVVPDMTPVEVVMVLQAMQRLRMRDHTELANQLLLQLEPCVPTMPAPQLSTLAEVLTVHPMRTHDEAKWRQIVSEVMERVMSQVEAMHSKEVVTFLSAASRLQLSPPQLCPLLARATSTAQFHTDEEVGALLRDIAHIQRDIPDPPPELMAAVAAMQKALMERLERVCHFVTTTSAATIWIHAAATQTELPAAIVQVMQERVILDLTFRARQFSALSRLAFGASKVKLPSTELLDVLSKYLLGERPPRRSQKPAAAERDDDDDGGNELEEENSAARAEKWEKLYSTRFEDLEECRINLEEAYAFHNATPPAALTEALPAHLMQHISEVKPRALLAGAWEILGRSPDCPLRNAAHEEAVLNAVLQQIERAPEQFADKITPAFVNTFSERLQGNAKAQEITQALQRVVK